VNVRIIDRTGVAITIMLAVGVPGDQRAAGRATVAAATNQGAKWSVPRTPWGHPDLQGVWTTTGMRFVPLERPLRLGTRDALNSQELERRVALNPDTGETITPGVAERASQMSRQASLVVDPANGRIPLTVIALEELKKREKDFRVENPERSAPGTGEMTVTELSGRPLFRNNEPASAADVDLWDRCITRGLPGVMVPTAYNNAIQILQTPDHVVIWYELLTKRIIPLDGRPHLHSNIRHWDGDARGRWEGDTLVVHTTNFRETRGRVRQYGSFDGGSSEMRIVERFTRLNAGTIKYEGTVIDPTVFTAPWTLSFPLEGNESYRLYEYACHEGNYSMSVRLSGARASNKEADRNR
jgi:hypothetical protein